MLWVTPWRLKYQCQGRAKFVPAGLHYCPQLYITSQKEIKGKLKLIFEFNYLSITLGRAVAKAVSRRLPTAATRVRARIK
jgi:hypothetical protein